MSEMTMADRASLPNVVTRESTQLQILAEAAARARAADVQDLLGAQYAYWDSRGSVQTTSSRELNHVLSIDVGRRGSANMHCRDSFQMVFNADGNDAGGSGQGEREVELRSFGQATSA